LCMYGESGANTYYRHFTRTPLDRGVPHGTQGLKFKDSSEPNRYRILDYGQEIMREFVACFDTPFCCRKR